MKKQYEDLWNTFCKKNHDYGSSFEQSLDKHGLIAGVVRMEDKMNRIYTLVDVDKHAEVASESLVDTLMDLSNYAAMSACWLEGEYVGDYTRAHWKPSPLETPLRDGVDGVENDKFGDMISKDISGSITTTSNISDEDFDNVFKLSSFEGHQEKVNERECYNREDVSDEEIIKNWGLVGDSKTVRSRTTGQYVTEDDNPELFRKIYGVLQAHNGYESFKKIKDKLTGTDEEFEGRFNDLKATVFEQLNRSREVDTTEGIENKEDEKNKQSLKQCMEKLGFKNHTVQPLSTELKGLENGYFIRQHINSDNSYRYTIAFNPEGTIKTQDGEEKPYLLECFGNDYDGMNVWAIHVFDTQEYMVAALNYDLTVRDKFKSKNFGDSIKGLDIKTSVYAPHDAPQVFKTWVETFGWAFDNNMKCKNLFSDGLFGISQGIKTFGIVFISEKTGALVIKGIIREQFSDRNHNFIWFSDTKEVLLELKNTVPKFNHHGIIYGIISKHLVNGDPSIEFDTLYQSMEDKIISKFNNWDASELKNLVFFNEDEGLESGKN